MAQVSTVHLHYDDKLCTLALVVSQMYGFPCNGFHLNVVSANLAHVREICPLSWYTLTQMSPSSVNRVIIMCIHVCMHHCILCPMIALHNPACTLYLLCKLNDITIERLQWFEFPHIIVSIISMMYASCS